MRREYQPAEQLRANRDPPDDDQANNIILHNNHNRIGVFDNRVGNNIEVMSNTSAAIRLRDNTVMGGLLIKGNTVARCSTSRPTPSAAMPTAQ